MHLRSQRVRRQYLRDKLREGRPALLVALKNLGVSNLGDRQALANAISRADRSGELTPSHDARKQRGTDGKDGHLQSPPALPTGTATASRATLPAVENTEGLLRALHFDRYQDLFQAQHWDLDTLIKVWREDGRATLDVKLKEGGLTAMGHRVKVIHAVETAAAQQEVADLLPEMH